MKSKNAFKKSVGEFDYTVGVGHVIQPLYFDEANERLQFFYNLYARIQLTKFEKWHEKTFQKNFTTYPNDKILFIRAWFPVLFNQFESADFYEPTNSQKFKMYISQALGGGTAVGDALSLPDLLNEFERRVLPFFDQFKTWDDVLENDFFS